MFTWHFPNCSNFVASTLTSTANPPTVARYNFITPNLCHHMHNSEVCATLDTIRDGDSWLSIEVPTKTASPAYKAGGVLFIIWDEGEARSDGPIGMLVLSPFAKGGGYSSSLRYTHSSTLRTIQEIFGVTPFLGDAAAAQDLSNLLTTFP